MWQSTGVPSTVYNVLDKFKPLFPCAHARHFWGFGWLVIARVLDTGTGTLQGWSPSLPARRTYWTLRRLVRAGQGEADSLGRRMAHDVVRSLPPPAAGLLPLSGETPRQDNRGQKHPLGLWRRENDHAPSPCGCDLVLLMASGEHCRLPMAMAPSAPDSTGPQNPLCRHMLATCERPAGVTEGVVTGDAGFCANETLRRIPNTGWPAVFAMSRTRTCTKGKYVRDLLGHLPRPCDGRRATDAPDGRRRDCWVCQRRATRNPLGAVTIVRAKKRRNHGPKHVSLFVTNLLEGKAGTVLSLSGWHWGVEVTRAARQSG